MSASAESTRNVRRVCVYCASSRRADGAYQDAAYMLGESLARRGITVVYGGGGFGLMGRLADGALAAGGCVVGVLPRFMQALEWHHRDVKEMQLVDDMHERKRRMLAATDAAVALPGGSGTLEELLEALTLKRLGLYTQPIVLVNVRGFFDPLLELLERAVSEHFMDDRHRSMWVVVSDPSDVVGAIERAPPWGEDARNFAVV